MIDSFYNFLIHWQPWKAGNIYEKRCYKRWISFGGIPGSRKVRFLQIFLKRAAKPSAGNTSAGFPWNLTWLCTKASQTSSGTFSGTFSGTLLNLTWLCTKASQNLLRNLLWNPVEPNLALHQSLQHLRAFARTLLNLTWLCTEASRPSPEPSPESSPEPSPCWAWPGSAPKPPQPPEPSPEPSPEPCWTWLGFAPRLPNLLRNLLQNLLRNPVERDLALHQNLPDLPRNLFRNLVEPNPAPAPVHTGAILGWRPH